MKIRNNLLLFFVIFFVMACRASEISLGPISQAFIRHNLKLFGYDSKTINTLSYRQGNGDFAMNTNKKIMHAPFNDNDVIAVLKALSEIDRQKIVACLKAEGVALDLDDFRYDSLENRANDFESKMLSWCKDKNERKKLFDPYRTYLNWQVGILHEMGHLKNNVKVPEFLWTTAVVLATWGIYEKYGWKKAGAVFVLFFPVIEALKFLINKRNEYSADQEVIIRAKNFPSVLYAAYLKFKTADDIAKALSAHADNCSLFSKLKVFLLTKAPIFQELFDVHPRHSTRASYFKKAYKASANFNSNSTNH